MIKTSYEVKIPRFYESNFLCVKEIENFFQNLKRLQLLLLKTVWFQFIMAFTTFMSTWTIKWVMHRQLVGHIGGGGANQPQASDNPPSQPTSNLKLRTTHIWENFVKEVGMCFYLNRQPQSWQPFITIKIC